MLNPTNLSPEHLKEAQQSAFRAGVKAGAPTLPGIAAWGMVIGVAMIKSTLSIPQALGMTFIVFAGSAQLAALPLIMANTPISVIFITSLIINLRFIIFSAILSPHFPHIPKTTRAIWSYIAGDLIVVLLSQRYPSKTPEVGKFEYLKGLIAPNWLLWQIGAVLGIFLAEYIPDSWGLSFAGVLAILCILLPMLKNHAILIGASLTGIFSLFTLHWPYKLGMLFATIVGMLAAVLWETWHERKKIKKDMLS